MKKTIQHCLCVLALAGALSYNFFFIGNYSALPWWHQTKNDSDPTNAGTTVGLLNNSDLQYISHPGATVYCFNGLAYRCLAFVDPGHRQLLHLSEVRSLNDAADILETATRTSRILALAVSVIFAGIFYSVLFHLTGDVLLSFLFTFYVFTAEAYLRHTYMVRSEIFSLLFVFLSGLLILRAFKGRGISFWGWMARFVATGFLLGFAVFSKIQTGPMIVIFILVLFCFLVRRQRHSPDFLPATPSGTRWALAFAVMNFVLMPWWAIKRPAFFTPKYIRGLRHTAHEFLAYGANPPPNFYLLVFIVFLSLFVVTLLVFVARNRRIVPGLTTLLFPINLSMNAMMTGLVLSAYVILLPVSGSFARYVENTRHLVYSVFTNILSANIMQHKVLNGQTIPKIIRLHALMSPIIKMNVLLFVGVVLIASVVRLVRRATREKGWYGAVVGAMAMGFIMDIFATLRGPKLYNCYACYSIIFYAGGLAIWTAAERRQEVARFLGVNLGRVLRGFVIAVLGLHVLYITQGFLRQPRATGQSDQTPFQEYLNTRTLARPFWKIVDESIERNND